MKIHKIKILILTIIKDLIIFLGLSKFGKFFFKKILLN